MRTVAVTNLTPFPIPLHIIYGRKNQIPRIIFGEKLSFAIHRGNASSILGYMLHINVFCPYILLIIFNCVTTAILHVYWHVGRTNAPRSVYKVERRGFLHLTRALYPRSVDVYQSGSRWTTNKADDCPPCATSGRNAPGLSTNGPWRPTRGRLTELERGSVWLLPKIVLIMVIRRYPKPHWQPVRPAKKTPNVSTNYCEGDDVYV